MCVCVCVFVCVCVCVCVCLSIKDKKRLITTDNLMSRVFAQGPRDRVSIPG